MDFRKEITLGNIASMCTMVAAVGLGWGTLSARVGAAEDRIDVLSKRIYDLEQERRRADEKFDSDRKRSDDKLESIKDRLSVLATETQVQRIITQQISDQLKAAPQHAPQPKR